MNARLVMTAKIATGEIEDVPADDGKDPAAKERAMIPRFDGSSAGKRLMVAQARRAKWAASRRAG